MFTTHQESSSQYKFPSNIQAEHEKMKMKASNQCDLEMWRQPEIFLNPDQKEAEDWLCHRESVLGNSYHFYFEGRVKF